jgi:predicted RNA binding protein YcfA (HicA-like mRNA interferase family)
LPKLPVVSGRQLRRVLEHFGWRYMHHTGSHMIFVKTASLYTLSVPDHKELDTGTLRALIRQAGLTLDEFSIALRD